MATISEDLRAAIQAALAEGATRYKISKSSGVDHSVLSRFLFEGRDIRISTADQLCEFLSLELRSNRAETKV
ncbi:hypothetical protein ACFL5Q_05590 [Planctomycetota bacterium]